MTNQSEQPTLHAAQESNESLTVTEKDLCIRTIEELSPSGVHMVYVFAKTLLNEQKKKAQ